MSFSSYKAVSMRSVAIAALILAAPLTAAYAQSTAPTTVTVVPDGAGPQTIIVAPAQTAPATPPALPPAMKAETVEERIAMLHASLQITPAEETNWSGVAQTMRDNAAHMEKLTAEKTAKADESLTAVEDLKTYERFAHAHFDGLKKLIASFETLYKSMPDAQKKVADGVFQTFGHGPSRG
jgi:hypothetical protein